METVIKYLSLLDSHNRKKAGLIIIMITIMALLEIVGVASILPFVTVLTNPDIIESNAILNQFFLFLNKFGVENNQQFLFVLGIIVFLVLMVSLVFKALTTYIQLKFVFMQEHNIGKRLAEGYLNQPYSWFLNRHSADFGKTILSEVQQLIGTGLNPLMELISKSMVVIAIIILLIVVDPKLAATVSVTLGGSYLIIFYFTRQIINRIGITRLKNNHLRFTIISEAFSAIKEIKIKGLEQIYIRRFSEPAQSYAQSVSFSQVLGQIPRFILEIIAFGGIMLIIIYMIGKTGTFNKSIPIISLYVFAGYRLMPALQQIYLSFTQITFVGPSLNKLYEDLESLKSFNTNKNQVNLPFNDKIVLNNIHYNYPGSKKLALKDISFTIPIKSTVGIIGSTGSGKTTIVDVILGLLEPQKGTLKIDKKIITKENIREWQHHIGYVPQHIYLSDDTVAANIAFGIEKNDINYKMVEKAAKIANLNEFILEELAEQYQTKVGERGVRLSGGQRQRIGIARALYHNSKVLIFDEATSALDEQTEKDVMKAISNLSKDMTIILIAHRLNTVKDCDIIFKIDKGQILSQGTYDEIINI